MSDQENNKAVVRRFNEEVIGQGNVATFEALMHPDFVNRSAPPGADAGPAGMINTFNNILRPALSGMRVEIYDQIAEGDKVTTRKRILGTHTGDFLGIAPTGRDVAIDVIDIVRLKDGQYIEHWGINTLGAVLASLKAA